MNIKNKLFLIVGVIAIIGNSVSPASAADVSSSGYGINTVRQVGNVQEVQVISVRKISIGASTTVQTAGTSVGAIVGGAAGAGLTGNNPFAKIAVGALAGMVGGLAGNAAAEKLGGQEGMEIIVKSGNNMMVVTQSTSDGAEFMPGEVAWLMNSGGATRLVKKI